MIGLNRAWQLVSLLVQSINALTQQPVPIPIKGTCNDGCVSILQNWKQTAVGILASPQSWNLAIATVLALVPFQCRE